MPDVLGFTRRFGEAMSARPITASTDRRAFFTPRSLAAYRALSERTVRQMLADGVIRSYLTGSARR